MMEDQHEYNPPKSGYNGKSTDPISFGMRVLLCIGCFFCVGIICEIISFIISGYMSSGGLVALIVAIVLTALAKTKGDYGTIFKRGAIAGVIMGVVIGFIQYSILMSYSA